MNAAAETKPATPAKPSPEKVVATVSAKVVAPAVKSADKTPAAPVPAKPVVAVKPTIAVKPKVAAEKVASQPVKAASSKAKAAPAKAAKPTKAVKPVKAPAAAKADKVEKAKKPKLMRDSFTIPKPEYAVIETLKVRAGKLGQGAKKSELLRAGIKALAALSDAAFVAALAAVPTIKTGRPAAAKS